MHFVGRHEISGSCGRMRWEIERPPDAHDPTEDWCSPLPPLVRPIQSQTPIFRRNQSINRDGSGFPPLLRKGVLGGVRRGCSRCLSPILSLRPWLPLLRPRAQRKARTLLFSRRAPSCALLFVSISVGTCHGAPLRWAVSSTATEMLRQSPPNTNARSALPAAEESLQRSRSLPLPMSMFLLVGLQGARTNSGRMGKEGRAGERGGGTA
jgi:hypothetical protein